MPRVLEPVPYPASRPTSLWTNAMTPMPVASRPFLNHERNPAKRVKARHEQVACCSLTRNSKTLYYTINVHYCFPMQWTENTEELLTAVKHRNSLQMSTDWIQFLVSVQGFFSEYALAGVRSCSLTCRGHQLNAARSSVLFNQSQSTELSLSLPSLCRLQGLPESGPNWSDSTHHCDPLYSCQQTAQSLSPEKSWTKVLVYCRSWSIKSLYSWITLVHS